MSEKTRDKRYKKGLCVDCGLYPFVAGITRCEKCNLYIKKRSKNRYRSKPEARNKTYRLRVENKLCINCGNTPLDGNTKMCFDCRLKHRTLRLNNPPVTCDDLKTLLEAQDKKCPYSGIELNLDNAEIDHLIPIKGWN